MADSADSRKFWTNMCWALSGNILYAACQWGLLQTIVVLGSPGMVGEFALALALVTPVFCFTNLNLRTVHVTDTKDRFKLQDIISLRLVMTVLAILFIATQIFTLSTSALFAVVVAAVAADKATNAVSEIFVGVHHKRERMKEVALVLAFRGISSLGIMITLLLLTNSLPIALLGVAAGNMVIFLLKDVPVVRNVLKHQDQENSTQLHLHVNLKILKPLFWLCLPVGLATALMSLNHNLPRYYIAHYLSMEELGIYAAAVYLLVVTELAIRSSYQAAMPRLAKYYEQQQYKKFTRLVFQLMGLGFACTSPFVLLAWVGGEQFLAWIYGPEYRQASDAFFWLMVANMIWQSSVPMVALWAMQIYWTDLIIHALATVCVAISGFFLVPEYGLVGAAWSFCIGRIAVSTSTAALVYYILNNSISKHKLSTAMQTAEATKYSKVA